MTVVMLSDLSDNDLDSYPYLLQQNIIYFNQGSFPLKSTCAYLQFNEDNLVSEP